MKTIKKYGLVLHEKDFGESDKILTILLKDFGKLNVYSRGAKKLTGKLFAVSRIFSCADFVINQNKNFYSLTNSDIIESLAPQNYIGFYYANYFCEIVDKFLIFNAPENNILLLLIKALKLLPNFDPNYIARIFEFKFMKLNGFEPQINFCHCCRQIKNKMYFDCDGLVCQNCLDYSKAFCKISEPAIIFLRAILKTKFNNLFDRSDIFSKDLIAPSRIFISSNLEIKLSSKKFICEIEN